MSMSDVTPTEAAFNTIFSECVSLFDHATIAAIPEPEISQDGAWLFDDADPFVMTTPGGPIACRDKTPTGDFKRSTEARVMPGAKFRFLGSDGDYFHVEAHTSDGRRQKTYLPRDCCIVFNPEDTFVKVDDNTTLRVPKHIGLILYKGRRTFCPVAFAREELPDEADWTDREVTQRMIEKLAHDAVHAPPVECKIPGGCCACNSGVRRMTPFGPQCCSCSTCEGKYYAKVESDRKSGHCPQCLSALV